MYPTPIYLRLEPDFVMNTVTAVVQAESEEDQKFALPPILKAIDIAEQLNGAFLSTSDNRDCEPGYKLMISCKIIFKSAEYINVFMQDLINSLGQG